MKSIIEEGLMDSNGNTYCGIAIEGAGLRIDTIDSDGKKICETFFFEGFILIMTEREYKWVDY